VLRSRRAVTAVLLFAVAATASPAGARALLPSRGLCDSLDSALCLLPFPNDRFTRPDPDTDTGLRVNISALEMPRSIVGKPIDPTEWNRQDGFSPGSMVLTFVPGLDLHRTWGTTAISTGGPNDPADHLADIGRYQNPDAPILLIDAQTGQRLPFWSELDNNAQTKATERILILRPAANFLEGHTILVGLRNMKDASGATIPAGAQFAAYRDNTPGPLGDVTFDESRRADVSGTIGRIETAERDRGEPFNRSDLYLAWHFTIASERNLSERVLHMRDNAFAQLGDVNLANGRIEGESPRFAITSVTNITTDARKQRQVDGTVTVPNYLTGDPRALPVEEDPFAGLPVQALGGRRLLYGRDGLPMVNPLVPTIDVPFTCTIPLVASASNPAHPMLYGHGLLGDRGESRGGSTDRDRERNFMPCAVNWMGFAEADVANAVMTLADPSNMPTMADRSQQGFVNFLFLGRALAHPKGLSSNAAFQDADHQPLFQSNELFYDGNSQGGIMGGALAALMVDGPPALPHGHFVTRSVLGVVGMNYSTLLNRSVDWEGPLVPGSVGDLPSYSGVLYTMFPNKMEQQLVMELLQMLWDRAEADGYAQHMTTDPYPNTPRHQILMHAAFGDFQVTNFAAETEARTIGARLMERSVPTSKYWCPDGAFSYGPNGLRPIPFDGSGHEATWRGSAFVYWDSGNLAPPNANVPPAETGGDPHEDPRRTVSAGDQKATFWLTGDVIDVGDASNYRSYTYPRI
jgi:hypothetical protein